MRQISMIVLAMACLAAPVMLSAQKTLPAPADVKAPPADAKTTSSGLRYKVLAPGKGTTHPAATNEVTVQYSGWTTDGKMFDSSVTRGEAATFPLNRVIKGWTEGMQLVGEGGMIELLIPSELGYGAAGTGSDIPGGATLHFLVELKKVK